MISLEGGELTATILGEKATFDGWTWTHPDGNLEKLLNGMAQIGYFRGATIDETARKILSFMRLNPPATIDSFRRADIPDQSGDTDVRQ